MFDKQESIDISVVMTKSYQRVHEIEFLARREKKSGSEERKAYDRRSSQALLRVVSIQIPNEEQFVIYGIIRYDSKWVGTVHIDMLGCNSISHSLLVAGCVSHP